MLHSESYYLLKLNPPPRSVRIISHKCKNNMVWDCPANEPCRIQINFLQTGMIRETREDEQNDYVEGTAYITCMGDQLHQDLATMTQELSLRLFLCVPPKQVSAEEIANRNIAIHEAVVPGLVKDPDIARQVGDLILATKLSAPPGDPQRSLKLRQYMYHMLVLLTQCSVDQARRQLRMQLQDWSRLTRKTDAYIRAHLGQKASVKAIAKAVGDNYDHLKTIFRRDTGMTLVEYINSQRIQRVKELLASGAVTTEKAGDAVGIQDTKYLGRLFRRYTGMTITEYRDLCRESQEL